MEENNKQQPENGTQPATGDKGRTFTQEEVNKIIQERLTRERAKAEPDPMEQREKDLAAREAAMTCKEYIGEKKYPAGLLELFDTSDAEQFKASVEKLLELFPEIDPAKAAKTLVFTKGTEGSRTPGVSADRIAEAFRPER